MSENSLATVCGLYCGFCRLYMNNECGGCGVGVRANCKLYKCCRNDKNLKFCTLCSDFPCESFLHSKCLHPDWVEELKKIPVKMNNPNYTSSLKD